jgi:hypothetical protein
MRAGADMRLLRAAVFAAACVVLTAAGHRFAAGTELPLWTLAAGWALILSVAVPLAGRERKSLPGVASVLGAGQLALHALFSVGQHGSHLGDAGSLARRLLCDDHAVALRASEASRIVHDAGPLSSPATGYPRLAGQALLALVASQGAA